MLIVDRPWTAIMKNRSRLNPIPMPMEKQPTPRG
jgi:hypothetical protein